MTSLQPCELEVDQLTFQSDLGLATERPSNYRISAKTYDYTLPDDHTGVDLPSEFVYGDFDSIRYRATGCYPVTYREFPLYRILQDAYECIRSYTLICILEIFQRTLCFALLSSSVPIHIGRQNH